MDRSRSACKLDTWLCVSRIREKVTYLLDALQLTLVCHFGASGLCDVKHVHEPAPVRADASSDNVQTQLGEVLDHLQQRSQCPGRHAQCQKGGGMQS